MPRFPLALSAVVFALALCFVSACTHYQRPDPEELGELQDGGGANRDDREAREPAPGGDLPLHPGCVELFRSDDGSCAGFAFDHGDLCVDCETGDLVPPGTPTNCIREYLPTTVCGSTQPYSKVHDCRDVIDGGECVYTGSRFCRVGWGIHPGRRSALCVVQ